MAIACGMASPTTLPDPAPVPPAADPQAIRACLTPTATAEFDREWEIVLDRVKQSMDLAGLHAWLNNGGTRRTWRCATRAQTTGCWPRPRQILRTGSNPGASGQDSAIRHLQPGGRAQLGQPDCRVGRERRCLHLEVPKSRPDRIQASVPNGHDAQFRQGERLAGEIVVYRVVPGAKVATALFPDTGEVARGVEGIAAWGPAEPGWWVELWDAAGHVDSPLGMVD